MPAKLISHAVCIQYRVADTGDVLLWYGEFASFDAGNAIVRALDAHSLGAGDRPHGFVIFSITCCRRES